MLSLNQLINRVMPTRQPRTLQQRLDKFVSTEARALDNLFAENGLASRIDGQRIDASQVAGYLRYHLKRADSVSKLTALSKDISAVMTEIRGHRVDAAIKSPLLYIDAPFPFERRALEWADMDLDSLMPHQMVVGRDYDGTSPVQVCIDYRERSTSNMLVSGVTGSGKTTALASSIVSLAYATSPKEAQIIIVDPKGSDILQPLRFLPHVSLYVGTDDSTTAIASVKAELNRRKTQRDNRKIYLVVEELAELFNEADGKDDLVRLLTSIASMGREKNIRVIACTQKPHIKAVDTILRASLPMKLAGMVNNKEESKVATGYDGIGCEFLPGKGSFYFLHDSAPTRVQSFYLPEQDTPRVVSEICQRWERVEPYRIEMISPSPAAVELPNLPQGVTAKQLLHIVGAFTRGQIFNGMKVRRGMRIQIIRAVHGEEAENAGHINKWAAGAINYLSRYWAEIEAAK